MIYTLYMFNRCGTCLFYQRWNQPPNQQSKGGLASAPSSSITTAASSSSIPSSNNINNQGAVEEDKAAQHEKKNMFGLLFSMKNFVNNMTPKALGPLENETWFSFNTEDYKLHYYETMTGIRIVLLTDKSVGRVTDSLKQIYRLYVDLVVKCPFYEPQRKDSPIDISTFAPRLDVTIRGLPFFN